MLRRLAALLLLAAAAPTASAGAVEVESIRLWDAPDHTRVVFDVSGRVAHELFTLEDPHRVVIDLSDARLDAEVDAVPLKDSLVRDIRSAARGDGDRRVVLDLGKRVRPKSFLLKPNAEYGHRLVVDLHDPAQEDRRPVKSARDSTGPREWVVAVDAGHGGEDPGARGRAGTLEKDVVLEIARRVARRIDDTPGMRAVMIREGDYYVSLRERIAKAREHRADLFLSIHADAFRDTRAHGSSVYVLSRNGATSEAASWLADRENSADLVGGVSLDDKDDLLASVLLDLSQSATIEASLDVADRILNGLEGVGRLHKHQPEQAGFVVLKSPDIPSVLVETAFISNPQEERRLRDPGHQSRLARSIVTGVHRYARHKAPEGTLWARGDGREHVISRGETLSQIAHRYEVSVDTLKSINDINGDLVRVGQTLQIPGGS